MSNKKLSVVEIMKIKGKKLNENKINFNYFNSLGPEIPLNFQTNEEWINNLTFWFSHVRSEIIKQCTLNEKIDILTLIRFIESGERPILKYINSNVIELLNYFSKFNNNYLKIHLEWIFTSLIFLERYTPKEFEEYLIKILTKIDIEISKINNKDNENLPFLFIIRTLISKFFHKC